VPTALASGAAHSGRYLGFGIRTIPAPADAEPRINRDEAIERAKHEPGVADARGPIDAHLVLYTDGDFGPHSGPPKYDQKLVWMVTAHDTDTFCTMCPTPPGPVGTTWVPIDAETGEPVDGVYTIG
jgi:hypothetical protein